MSGQSKWFLLILLALIWGSSFILIKRGLVGLDPYQLGSLRIVFTAVFLLAIGFKTLPQIPRHKWKYVALTAFFGTFVPAFLFSIAETEIDSSITSILNSLTPLNTIIFGFLLFSIRAKRNQLFGVFIGMIGSALLILNGALNHPDQNYYYALLVLIASICYAINVNLIKKFLSDVSPLAISTGNFIVMFIPAFAILLYSGFFAQIGSVEVQQSAGYILILAVVGTGIANLLFFKLIQTASPIFATSVTYLIPIVAFGWGVLDGESLTAVQLFGALIILAGVYLSSKK